MRFVSRAKCFVLAHVLFAVSLHGFTQSVKLNVIPYPKEVKVLTDEFLISDEVVVVIAPGASAEQQFNATTLVESIRSLHKLTLRVATKPAARSISLVVGKNIRDIGQQGYLLSANKNGVQITANTATGVYYGVQTLIQLIGKHDAKLSVGGINIKDFPDTEVRAVHYDTKHHQDNAKFVHDFIKDLASYKINMLVWEWEDKFEYPSHPEIGAPGAFTMSEMQEFTRYAKKHHIQLVPLVQGLGHAGFILKWPQFASLREIPASNFEFCPLKEKSYELLGDLWKDAIEATPGAEYIHIGSDETYELGKCDNCRRKEKEIGKSGLYHLFLETAARRIQQKSNRQVMAWEAPMGWEQRRLQVYHAGDSSADKPVTPVKGLVLTESYDYETDDLQFARKAKMLGYPVFAYDPNPGIEQLFLPYFFAKDHDKIIDGALKSSYDFLKRNISPKVFDGMIRTSWDDSGLPMQAWTLSFVTSAAYSWNASAPALEMFTSSFFRQRYGDEAQQIDTLYRYLNEGAYFYMESFERRVWAWGEIGKTHIPDLPRGDAIEYDPFWNTQYADRVALSREFVRKMNKAIEICDYNIRQNVNNRYEVEVFKTLAELMRHTALTYLDLSNLENTIKEAHQLRFVDIDSALKSLHQAELIVEGQLKRRDEVFNRLVSVWEKTRLSKGMDTPGKQYFFQQERTRHFANRTPDMGYLIVDEQQLNLEEYLLKLKAYRKQLQEELHAGVSSNTNAVNSTYVPNTIFLAAENLRSEKFEHLRKKYHTDTIFHGETDEFKRMLLIRNWIRKTISINDPGPHPGDGTCESILDNAIRGAGYHCGHFMVVQNAIMNAYGYVTRCLGAGPGGVDGIQNHHGINEVWSNTYKKWFLSDAKYNSHFEKNGIPLSALEVRDEYLKNKGADMIRAKGIARTPVEFDAEYNMSKAQFARTYVNIEWDMFGDKYVRDSAVAGDRGILIMYNDEYFQHHPWLWDGKPHWAYDTKFMNLVSDRSAIEWTPNTIQSTVIKKGGFAEVTLVSSTPNFKSYQIRRLPNGKWEDIPAHFNLKLGGAPEKYEIRAVNIAAVAGPVHLINIE